MVGRVVKKSVRDQKGEREVLSWMATGKSLNGWQGDTDVFVVDRVTGKSLCRWQGITDRFD